MAHFVNSHYSITSDCKIPAYWQPDGIAITQPCSTREEAEQLETNSDTTMAKKTKKPQPLVTKDSLIKLLSSKNPRKIETVIGRALAGLYKRQTEDEKSTSVTKEANGVGFAAYDAELGSKVAKTWLKDDHLAPWMIESWLKPNKKGVPRICKYHRQLNEIALEKRQ